MVSDSFMVSNSFANPRVRAAVRTVLAGGALAASFGVAHAQTSTQPTSTQPTSTQQTSTQQRSKHEQSSAPQLLAQTVSAAATSSASSASSSALQLQEVVVTGSRIAVPNQTSISPVTLVSSQQFAQIGATRVEDVLNRLPQVFADQNSTSINGGTGTETVDLRGLGAQRTLVLIDGLRLPYGDPRGGGSDLKLIPTALIQNVQILTGGASSIYGADAVAGVVNFKLLDNFQGVKLVANGGGFFHDNNNNQNVESDLQNFDSSTGNTFPEAPGSIATGAQKELTFIAGLNSPDNKGNATFYLSYRNIAKATQNLFSYSACSLDSGYLPGPRNPDGPDTGTGNFRCGGSLTSFPGTFLKFAGGSTAAANTVGPGGALLPLSAESRFNFGPLNYLQAPDVTWDAGAFIHYDLNDHATIYNSVIFLDDKTALQIAPSGDFGNAVNVNCANPYLSAAEVTAWCGGSTAGTVNSGGAGNGLYILRRNVEGGNRVDDLEHTDWRFVLGVKGAISDNWTYDTSYQYSAVNLNDVYRNDVSIDKLNDATDVVNGPNGPQCAVTAEGITTGTAAGCVPYNIFGTGPVDPRSVAYISTPGVLVGAVTQQIIDTNFTGDLSQYVQLPTAHSGLQVALGTEYRDVTSYTEPDQEFQGGDLAGQGGATLPVSGSIETWDEYAELRLPLLEDLPFAKSLATDDSYRHSSYGLGFNTNTYSLGLAWSPTQDVRLRGTFTRAVRAPSVTELYAPDSVNLDGTEDPCAGATPVYSAAQCARTGVPVSRYGSIAANPAAQYNGLTGGFGHLGPETAITSSYGLGLTPHWIPNFRAQIDYYDIRIEGVIRSIGANTILDDCATADLFCSNIHRDATGSLWLTPNGYVNDQLGNFGELEEKGVDVDLSYSDDLGRWGSISTNFNGNYISSYTDTSVEALPSSAYDCAGLYGPTCSSLNSGAGGPLFKWRHDWTATWITPLQPLAVTLGWRFYSAVTLESLSSNPNLSTAPNTVANGGISNTDARIPSFSYIDLSAAYNLTDNILVRLGCNNLFDKDPPVIGASNLPSPPIGNGNTLPGTYDAGGRYVFGEISVQL